MASLGEVEGIEDNEELAYARAKAIAQSMYHRYQ